MSNTTQGRTMLEKNTNKDYPFTQQADATFRFEPIGENIDEWREMVAGFYKDYEASGDWLNGERGDMSTATILPNLIGDDYLVKIGDKTVGWVTIMQLTALANCVEVGTDSRIENVYVKPEFRGFGLAKRIYHKCIQEYDATQIHLSYARISGSVNQQYWKSVGFNYITVQLGQIGSRQSLCALVTELPPMPALKGLYNQLDKEGVAHAKRFGERIAKTYTRLTGENSHTLQYNPQTLTTVLRRMNAKIEYLNPETLEYV